MKKKELKVKVVKCEYAHAVTDYQDFTVPSTKEVDRRKLDIGDIWSNKIQCKKCKWFIRSKNRHNFVRCKCGAMFIDGGSWYSRIGGDQDGYINYIEYYDDVKKKKIYNKGLRKKKSI
jgi:hypothetical protein